MMPNPMMEFDKPDIDGEAIKSLKYGCIGFVVVAFVLPFIIYLLTR